MRATVASKTLSESLNHFKRILPKESGEHSILKIDLLSDQDQLQLTGSNGEIDLLSIMSAEVHQEGSLLVPARTFAEIVKVLEGEAELSLDENELKITDSNFEFKIPTVASGEFPDVIFPHVHSFVVDNSALKMAISSVRYAASEENFTNIFRGIKLEKKDEVTGRLVASDGYRVAIRDFPIKSGEVKGAIVPARNFDEILKIFRDDELSVAYDGNVISIASQSFKMNLKSMDGEFPDYNRSIPDHFLSQVDLEAQDLLDAIARLSILADKNNNHRIEFALKPNELGLSVHSEMGHGERTLPISGGPEDILVVAFNANYIKEALAPIEGPVRIRFAPDQRPAVFEPIAEQGYKAVLVVLKAN